MSEPFQFAYITPACLVYYRKRAGLTTDQAAKGVCLRYELEHAEIGITRLSMQQFRTLAAKYQTPITAFYKTQIPTKKEEWRAGWRNIMQQLIQKLINRYDFDSKDFFEDWW
jgi:hypothetical protein